MKFRTEINISPSNVTISHADRLFFIGSCFANNIGGKVEESKFEVMINPYGIIYNPISITTSIQSIVSRKIIDENHLISNNGIYHSLSHHSEFSGSDKNGVLDRINERQVIAHDYLKQANVIFITLGSAWVYKYLKSGEIVANCHKIPNKEFSKELLTINEIDQSLKMLIELVRTINPSVQFIFTVSPVRHLKDGVVENNLSKSSLILAVHNIVKSIEGAYYFPAYEIVMDDLRDYRFYKDDMIHPSEQATKYIWGKFTECFFDRETKDLIEEISRIKRAADHRPFDLKSDQHKQFLQQQIIKINKLQRKNEKINLSDELSLFHSLLD